jgi:hypothetical protein
MITAWKKAVSIMALVAFIAGSNAVYAEAFSDSTSGGGGGAYGHRAGTIIVPDNASCLYFGGIISDGHNPPGTAYIYGPRGNDTINYSGHSNPAATSFAAIAPGTYNYTLDAYGMVYCGLVVQW